MSYEGTRPQDCAAITRPIFRSLAPYISDAIQLLFVRDQPEAAIDGKYINGAPFFRNASSASVTAGPANPPGPTPARAPAVA